MARALESRIAKLEKGDRGTEDGGPFYLLWIEPGEDRAMALAAAHRHGSLADVPIYCAEWKAPESFTRRGRILGQRPRSRVTNQRRLSEDEVAVLSESICDDFDSSGFSPSPYSGDDVRGEERLRRMTDRELVGKILSGGGPATLRASLRDPEMGTALPITRQDVSAARQSGKLQALSHKPAKDH